jgi:hypothetical protein
MLDYFSVTLYPRFEYRVVATYDKAVEYLSKRQQYCRETDKPFLPTLVLNPSGEFLPADSNAGGRFTWRYPNLSPTFVKRLFQPIYRDANTIVHAGMTRMKGDFELLMLLNSFYEYADLRQLMITYFGGLERIIYPRFFSSFIIIPEDMLDYEYTNEYTGVHYKLKWSEAGAYNKLVRSTAKNELVLPLNVKPQISLQSLSDSSSRYGGTDKLADWRLTASINYEIEIPTFLVIESDYLAENIDLEIRMGSAFSEYPSFQPPINRLELHYSWDWGLDETSNTLIIMDPENVDTTCDVFVGDFIFNTRYFHEITQAQVDATANVEIKLPEQIINQKTLIVNSAEGPMSYGDNYIIKDNGWTLVLKTVDPQNVFLEVGWVLELYVYHLL